MDAWAIVDDIITQQRAIRARMSLLARQQDRRGTPLGQEASQLRTQYRGLQAAELHARARASSAVGCLID